MRCRSIAIAALPMVALAAAGSPDHSFLTKAAEGGIAEVEQGTLAQERGHNQAVKDFGAMMVKDHSAANERLKSLASTKGLELPKKPDASQTATKEKLEALTGDTFDKSYIKGMVEDHKEDIKEFESEARNGQDPDAKAFAAKTLPTLRAHLEHAQKVAEALGVKTE